MSKTRTFVAIELADPLRRKAAGLIDRLRPYAGSANWVEEENLNLTLLFLGDLGDAEVADACDRVDWTARANQPFTVRVAGVGAFPDLARPRALWVGVTEGADPLVRLQADLNDALGDLIARKDNKKFIPHWTLARMGRGGEALSPHLPDVLARLGEHDLGEMEIDRVTVFASELRRNGPEYHPLAQCRLGMGS